MTPLEIVLAIGCLLLFVLYWQEKKTADYLLTAKSKQLSRLEKALEDKESAITYWRDEVGDLEDRLWGLEDMGAGAVEYSAPSIPSGVPNQEKSAVNQ